MDVLFLEAYFSTYLSWCLKFRKRPFYAREWQKYGAGVTFNWISQKVIAWFIQQSVSSTPSSIMPYPTRSCVVIEPATPFMGFLVQLEPFDCSALKTIDQQKLVYEMFQEESISYEQPSPSINHELSVPIDFVTKISVNRDIGTRVSVGTSVFFMKTFFVKGRAASAKCSSKPAVATVANVATGCSYTFVFAYMNIN